MISSLAVRYTVYEETVPDEFTAVSTGKLKYLDAYRHILATQESLDMWFIKVIFLGAPRLGKTTARRRLGGEIADISSSGEAVQPSTGVVESGVVIRNLSRNTVLVTPSQWSVCKNLMEEARMIFQFLYNHTREKTINNVSNDDGNVDSPSSRAHIEEASVSQINTSSPVKEFSKPSLPNVSSNRPKDSKRRNVQSKFVSEVAELFHIAAGPKYWKDIKHLFKDTALLKMEDTGGQPEFMDMLPALTIGPALYLLFCKLIDDLLSNYTVSYLSESGEFTTPVQSTYTVEEVLLTALASVSCFNSYSTHISSDESSEDKLLRSCNKSVAYILGTHKDLVTEQEIAEFDEKLQNSIRSTDFFQKNLVQFSSQDRMVLPIDNMHGGEDEIKKVRQFLEEGMKKHFKKLSIPASWLVLSLCLRKREERTASLQSVLQLAGELGMLEREAKLALWFLHHYAGVLMYFPKLAELKDTVISDTQIVYDSATNLIVNTFKFGTVSVAASERFRETGQFSLEDIRGATAQVSGDYIPLLKLVKLLEHLNIIAPITTSPASSSQSSEVTYFMPCVLQNATHEELDEWWKNNSSPHSNSPAPLFIHYNCGFSLIGVFPAMIANLVGNKSLHLVVDGIKKNRMQFLMLEGDYDTVTLISHPKYYAAHITREPDAETPIHEVCSAVRGIVESTLNIVTSNMNYSFCAEYQLSFECPSHPGRDHLCTVSRKDAVPRFMCCQSNKKQPRPVKMQSQHLTWFGIVSCCEYLFTPRVLSLCSHAHSLYLIPTQE